MPLGNTYASQSCSVARSLEVIGERWTLLIVRDVMLGLRRFDEIQANLGVARNILQARLERLVAEDILTRRAYQDRPPRHEYRLTEKGLDLWPAMVALMQWGDEHAAGAAGAPVVLTHRDCGGAIDAHRTCARCGERVGPRQVRAAAGPGAGEHHPLRRRAAASG